MRLGEVVQNREELMERFVGSRFEFMAFEALYGP